MVARISLFSSTKSASLIIMLPRSVVDMSRHDGSLNAFRAAATAMSTSSGPPAYTETISFSSLQTRVVSISRSITDSETDEGFMLVILSPLFDLTNSLLMNSPVFSLKCLPLGAVRSANRSDMLTAAVFFESGSLLYRLLLEAGTEKKLWRR
jgi:hypothetical protein